MIENFLPTWFAANLPGYFILVKNDCLIDKTKTIFYHGSVSYATGSNVAHKNKHTGCDEPHRTS